MHADLHLQLAIPHSAGTRVGDLLKALPRWSVLQEAGCFMSHTGKSPRSALSERLLASNSPGEVAIDIPRPERSSNASAPGIQPDTSWATHACRGVPIGAGVV